MSALKERHGEDHFHILVVKQNSGYSTYDGIEVGGERAVHEIEETLATLSQKGVKVGKISVVGYSLGGLVARYAVGLLYARGWFEKLEPVNFTTFASPHVGVRSPLKGIPNQLWNVLGARTVSVSGQQMFMIDKFRDTGKPLLSVLADPESIFIKGLAKFRNRTVYGNAHSDRVTVFYTSTISKFNPFNDIEDLHINYMKGYEPVIINYDDPILEMETPDAPEPPATRIYRWVKRRVTKVFFGTLVVLFLPLAITLYMTNAAIQTFRSQRRIKFHHDGKAGKRFAGYRVPLIVQDVRHAVEEAYENVNQSQDPEYLSDSSKDFSHRRPSHSKRLSTSSMTVVDEKSAAHSVQETTKPVSDGSTRTTPSDEENQMLTATPDSVDAPGRKTKFPILALTPEQLAIIDSLNAVGFQKYPVYIHNHHRSHAAIIVREPKKAWVEGKVVIRHWLDNEFDV